jgi:hypothetical protein
VANTKFTVLELSFESPIWSFGSTYDESMQ